MKRLACAVTISLATLVSTAAVAQTADDIKAAGRAFDQAKRAFKAEEWVDAAEQFENAYGYAPSAVALELAIRARDRAGQLERAATLAEIARTRTNKSPANDKLQKLATEVLAKAKSKLHELRVKCDTPCELVQGTRLVYGKAATERTIHLTPGTVIVRATWSEGRSQENTVTATAGGSSEANFTTPPKKPKPKPVVTPTAPARTTPTDPGADTGVTEESSGWSPVIFWTGLGVTAVLGGVTVWSGIDTQNNPGPDAIRDKCGSFVAAGKGDDCPEYQDGRSRQSRTNILAGVTAGVGVVTLLVGAFATDWAGTPEKTAKRSSGFRVSPWVGLNHAALSDGATLGAVGRF